MNIVAIALAFNVMDLITGISAAVKEKDIESSKLRDGLFKKAGFLFCYVLAILIDNNGVYIGLNISVKILPVVVLYVVTTEIVSIIENICRLNSDLLPEKLLDMFHAKH